MVQRVIGWALAAFGCIGWAIEIDKLATGRAEDPVLGFVMGAVFVLAGLALARPRWLGFGSGRASRPDEDAHTEDMSASVVQAAAKFAGRITVLEAVSATGLSIASAGAALEQLAEQGYCQKMVGEGGLLFFLFPEFERADIKRDILEERFEEGLDGAIDAEAQHATPRDEERPA